MFIFCVFLTQPQFEPTAIRIITGGMLVPCTLRLHLKLSKNTVTVRIVSFTIVNKQLINSETQSLCIHVRHWRRGDNFYVLVLLGASTIMTTLGVWHNITRKTQNCWSIKVVLLLLCSKQLPSLWNCINQWNTDFALPLLVFDQCLQAAFRYQRCREPVYTGFSSIENVMEHLEKGDFAAVGFHR